MLEGGGEGEGKVTRETRECILEMAGQSLKKASRELWQKFTVLGKKEELGEADSHQWSGGKHSWKAGKDQQLPC